MVEFLAFLIVVLLLVAFWQFWLILLGWVCAIGFVITILIVRASSTDAIIIAQQTQHFPAQEVRYPICTSIKAVEYAMQTQGYRFIAATGDYRLFKHPNGNEAVMKREDTPWQAMECLVSVGDPNWYLPT